MNVGDRVYQSTWNRTGEVATIVDYAYDDTNPHFPPMQLFKVIYKDGYWCWCKPEELKKENV
jgi:hypothetical protein